MAAGRARGLDLPDPAGLNWVEVRSPTAKPTLPFASELGSGESEVLALGAEHRDAILILDDAVARRVAQTLGLKFTGTLGLLIDAKKAGMIDAVAPLLDALQACRFRVAARTREAVLQLAGER